ncbi:MAG: hypothetical protein VB018_01820 [Lachnospiraceae bacterium]|nr:hypothetical protein [Lachnospiraceae bacterium]
MSQDKNQFINSLLEAYETYFDIKKNIEIENIPIAAEAIFHSRSEKYVLVQSAKLWAVETNEYAYFITKEVSSAEEFKKLRDKVLEIGLKKIRPHNEHMYSYITMIYIAENIDEVTTKEIENFNCHKMFLLSLHGWMYFRIAAVDLSKNIIITNKRGREIKGIVKKVMQSA